MLGELGWTGYGQGHSIFSSLFHLINDRNIGFFFQKYNAITKRIMKEEKKRYIGLKSVIFNCKNEMQTFSICLLSYI